MPNNLAAYKKNLLQNMASSVLFAVLISLMFLSSVNTSIASFSSPSQTNVTTVTPQTQPQVPSEGQRLLSPPQPPQPPQIAWNELVEADSFVASGKIDSLIYTIHGKWSAIGDWRMNVFDGQLTFFNTSMTWYNGTSGHSHEFLDFETTEDVDISAEDQTISISGTMDIGTNGVVSWQEIPAEILIEAGRIITVSLDDEGTNRHFGGQSVHGNVTSLSICTAAPGPSMEVSLAC